MLEKKSASGVHLTPKEAVSNLLLNDEDEGMEEEARREEEEAEVEEEAEHRLLQQKKSGGKPSLVQKGKRSEEMDDEGRHSGCSNQGSEDQEDKITFNPGPDIPIIAGVPESELLDEEHPTPEPKAKACTALVPYSSPFRFIPSPKTTDEENKSGIGSFCAPPGMPLSVNKHVTPKTPASLASIDLEALSPKHLSLCDLPDGKALDVGVPKMSYPGNHAIVGFLEPRKCKSPVPKIMRPPVPSGEIGVLFSPPGEELFKVPNPPQMSHFDPCVSPVSPFSARVSPFSKGVAGAAFPRLQIGGSSSHPPSVSSSRCQETESQAATPLENSVPESNPELDAREGLSPQQLGRKTGSYVWFEDEAAARAGSVERIQTLGSPPETDGNDGVAEYVNSNNNNNEDEWEWVCPDGGWGWLVLAGSMLVNALVPGMVKSFGVLFLEFLRVFHASPLAASWIPALCYFLYSSLGPVACVLSNRFSYRMVTFLGGFLAAMGLILSYFAHSITYLYLSYGLMVGAGAGLAFPPGVFIVASYFDKRRGLANGLCVSGSALGSILLPPFLRYLLVTYGYRGAVLLMGGITFHVWVGALLYHPVEKHMKRVRCKDLLALEGGKSKESEMANEGNEKDPAKAALLKRSEAVPIPGQRKVFWYVGKSPGDEEELAMHADGVGDPRKKSTVQQQASMHRRRRRSFSPVDERPLVEVDEEEEGIAQNPVVKAKQIVRVESAHETEGMAKTAETDSIGRKDWRSGSRQRKTSRGFAESVPEEVEDEAMAEEISRNKSKYHDVDVPCVSSQGTAPLTGSPALLGSTQSHLQHLSPKPAVLPRSLSAASYASTSTAPPPAPMGKMQPALSASLSSFRFVSSIHHGSALAALQTEGSVSVLAASTFTLRSVGGEGGFWERIRSNLLGGSSSQNVSRDRCKPCNCLGKQHNEKEGTPVMSGAIMSGKNMPAMERICNHHSLDRRQLGQVGERKVSVASFISARDVKLPSESIEIPRKFLDSQENSCNCTPKMNGGNLSPVSLQVQDWSSNNDITTRDENAKAAYELKDEKEGNSLLTGQFVRRADTDSDCVSSSKKSIGSSPSKKNKKTKSKGKSVRQPKKQPQPVPKKKLFDLSLLTDSMYLILLLSNSTSAIGYTNFTILLPAWAASLGFNTSEASLLLSVVAATDLIGRIGGAALSDLRFMPRRWYYVGGLAVSGVVLAFLPLFSTGPALMDQLPDNGSPFALYTPASEALVSSLPPFEVSGATSLEPYAFVNNQDIQNKVSTNMPSVTDAFLQNSTMSRMVREIADTPFPNSENGYHDDDGRKITTVEDYEIPIVQTTRATVVQSERLDEEEGEETHMSSAAYLQLSAACAIFGLSSGAYVGVTAALFSDMLGPERLASSFGLSLLANGILQLAGPPLCGLALSSIPSESGGSTVSTTTSPVLKRSTPEVFTPGPAAYAPIISTLGLFLVAGAGMWGFMPSIERKRREKNGGVMI